jgi:hypothetical protein
MISLEYEMTYWETIEGPLPSTKDSPLGERLCWTVAAATLKDPRIDANLAMPGTDWVRLGVDGIRRQDLRVQLMTEDGTTILMTYNTGVIRSTEIFLQALAEGKQTSWSDQHMRIVPEFIVGSGQYSWLDQNLFVGEGRLAGPKEIEYAIYRIG